MLGGVQIMLSNPSTCLIQSVEYLLNFVPDIHYSFYAVSSSLAAIFFLLHVSMGI